MDVDTRARPSVLSAHVTEESLQRRPGVSRSADGAREDPAAHPGTGGEVAGLALEEELRAGKVERPAGARAPRADGVGASDPGPLRRQPGRLRRAGLLAG